MLTRLRRAPLVRRIVTPLVLASFLAGCSTWRTRGLQDLGSRTPPPERIRVMTTDGLSHEIYWPIFTDIAVTGWATRDSSSLTGRRVVVELDRIEKAQVHDASHQKTLLIGGIVVGGLVGVSLLVVGIAGSGKRPLVRP